jgi:hypothetical protein
MAAVHIIWTVIIAVATTGWKSLDFNAWFDAGYNTQLLVSFIFKGIQLIMWPIAYTGASGAHAFTIYTSMTVFIDSSIGLLGIIFMILSVTIDNKKLTGDFLWSFAGTFVVDLIIMVHDFISIEALLSWYTFKMAADT